MREWLYGLSAGAFTLRLSFLRLRPSSSLFYNVGSLSSSGCKAGGKTLSAVNRKSQVEPSVAEWEETPEGEVSGWQWTIASGAILLVGAFLRVYDLALKPLHHDEGVNGFFLQRLVKEGVYNYDPANYHGPTLYYFTLASTALNSFFHGHTGLGTVAVRLVPAIFGIATIWLVLCLRRHIGSLGALAAAALLSVSPGAVYLSRYFIHEALFVFFTLGVVVAWLKYYDGELAEETRETAGIIAAVASVLLVAATLGAIYKPEHRRLEVVMLLIALAALVISLWLYDGERATYLMMAAMSAALLFATKETAMISAGVLLIAAGMGHAYLRLLRPPLVEAKKKKQRRQRKKSGARASVGGRLRETLERFGGPTHIAILLLAALALFVMTSALFYSSFFTNAKGITDAFETFNIWARTGTKDHRHPIYKYVRWLVAEESGLLLLGGAGVLLAVWRANSRFIVVAALWAVGIIAAYSLIPYKTPWLALNFIVPLAIMGGYAVETIYRLSAEAGRRALVAGVTIVALGFGAYQAVQLNFFHYDDERYVYVYAHTVRELLPLIEDVNLAANQAGTGRETGITVTAVDYWPLPWYLRDYNKVGYFGRLSPPSEPIIICSEQQEAELKNIYAIDARYRRVKSYPLRSAASKLVLYVRRDVPEGPPAPAATTSGGTTAP